ncbi:MAG: helix-turn-helix domain-containing protein [Candidatus Roizmanbacteria bacterium]|nr:helix-turn-helix domain-containing protein [Candidatus Roizmanbacteria bacterium]
MHTPQTKHTVKKMREDGTSIDELVKVFNISKSTISYWCRDIILKESAIQKIKTKGREKSVHALLRYSEILRAKRIKRTLTEKRVGADMVGKLLEREFMMVGLGLYWGEGYKESNGELGFTNSNPEMIRFYLSWLQKLGVSKSDLIFRLTINNIFRKDEVNIKEFWFNFLGIMNSQFSKTTVIKTKIKKGFTRDLSKYKGILRVKVRKGLSLKNKILGAIDHISSQV